MKSNLCWITFCSSLKGLCRPLSCSACFAFIFVSNSPSKWHNIGPVLIYFPTSPRIHTLCDPRWTTMEFKDFTEILVFRYFNGQFNTIIMLLCVTKCVDFDPSKAAFHMRKRDAKQMVEATSWAWSSPTASWVVAYYNWLPSWPARYCAFKSPCKLVDSSVSHVGWFKFWLVLHRLGALFVGPT